MAAAKFELNTLDFAIAEILESHRAMDKAYVPTHSSAGERLSLSQRVDILSTAFAGMSLSIATIWKAKEA